ncbi:MAG: PH domain-containing protein [Polaribacter sp.]|nr:PH domain-containing protein [Polaribacter sp.]
MIYYKKEFPKRCYLVREKDISFKDGLITRKTTTIPFSRVQHVAINEKVYGRIFGLASLIVYTAGDSASDLEIDGLELEKANQIKEYINEKVNE